MEFTAPMWWAALKAASALTVLTRSWQSSKTPSTAMLTMAGSSMLNICACWNGLILPRGVSMNTVTRPLPSMACSAAEPVSPLVAPTIVRVVSRRSSSYSNSCPSNCIAMSLNAAVGPFDRWPSSIPPVRSVTPTTRASPNAAAV